MHSAISVEWLDGRKAILRHHPKGDDGGEFDLVAVLIMSGTHAVIKGLLCRGRYTRAMRRAITEALKRCGATVASFERRNTHPRAFTLTR